MRKLNDVVGYGSDNIMKNICFRVVKNLSLGQLLAEIMTRRDMKENWEYANEVIENLDAESKKRLNLKKNDKEIDTDTTVHERQQNALDAMKARQMNFESMFLS